MLDWWCVIKSVHHECADDQIKMRAQWLCSCERAGQIRRFALSQKHTIEITGVHFTSSQAALPYEMRPNSQHRAWPLQQSEREFITRLAAVSERCVRFTVEGFSLCVRSCSSVASGL